MSNRKKTLLLLLSSILTSLILGEVIVRFFVPQETKRLAIYDKELGWRGRPGGSGVYIRKEDSIFVPFRYNALGFRDDEIQQRSAVGRRFVFVGDSFVENMEVPLEKTFVSIVRKQLRDESKSHIDLVALSSQGYSTAQELLALKKFYDLLRPDYVVLFFYTGNDFEDNLRREFAYLDPNGNPVFPENQTSWLKQQFLSFKRWMYESSYLVFFFKNLLESYSAMNLGDESKNISTRSKEYQFEITRKLVVEMKRFVEERGAKFGLVLFTNKHQMREGHLGKTEFIEHVCKEARIPYVEVTHVLRPEHFFKADEHFTETGHRIVAERVHEYLARTFLRGDSAAHPNIQSRLSEMDESK